MPPVRVPVPVAAEAAASQAAFGTASSEAVRTAEQGAHRRSTAATPTPSAIAGIARWKYLPWTEGKTADTPSRDTVRPRGGDGTEEPDKELRDAPPASR